MIDHKTLMGRIHRKFRITVGKLDVRKALVLGQRLQVAMSIGHANRANMISLREKQLEDHAAILSQTVRFRRNIHPFFYPRDARRKQFSHPFYLDQTEAASPHIA